MSALPAWFVTMLRGGVQAAWGLVVAWLGKHGLDLGISNELVVGLMLTGVIAGVLGGLRWLETRQGNSVGAKLARGAARALMFGLSRLQPVYVEPGVDRVQVNGRIIR
jgi:hypothetical protein